MTAGTPNIYDVAVVGAGMAGMSSALFAANRGLSCIQIGNGGGILFASGLLDLLAVHPIERRHVWKDPFMALQTLTRELPGHPLAKVTATTLGEAISELAEALGAGGMPYAPLDGLNCTVMTSIGTGKTSYGIPLSMVAGVSAIERRPPCLLVDFRGLREFSARQIVSVIGPAWPGLRHERIVFPGFESVPETYSAHLARALESPEVREAVINGIKRVLGDAQVVGMPAILGVGRSDVVHRAFEAGLGVPVFEIPTMPTSVPGLRMKDAIETVLAQKDVERRVQAKVTGIEFGDVATLTLNHEGRIGQVFARSVILASGRFMSRGLVADRERIVEGILGLHVAAPANRNDWHRQDFLDPKGHQVNQAGLVTDPEFRVVDGVGGVVWPRLYAVGSILGGQDWMRQKCGTGLSVGTAMVAVLAIVEELGRAVKAG